MTKAKTKSNARAIADLSAGTILAEVSIAAPPERVFSALASAEVTKWWGSDDSYRTTGWEGDVRVGGHYRATGVGNDGKAFGVRGEYLEVDPPRRLVQTWEPDWDEGSRTTVTYLLEAIQGGTRVTLRHTGFGERRESCAAHGEGWELVLGWLDAHAAPREEKPRQYFVVKLIPPRTTFMMDMSADERAVMMAHVGYWTELLHAGNAVVFGPVADPVSPHGVGILCARDEQELRSLLSRDPAVLSPHGLRHEVVPMLQAVVRD